MRTPTVYLIWYGNWNQINGSDTPAGQTIVNDFLYGLSGSPYYQTNASYGTPTGSFAVGGTYTDTYSQGSTLSDQGVANVVANAINSGGLFKDNNGIYFVLTSSDVAETSGFCSRYCGWHTYGTLGTTNIKYAFVGNANRCLNAWYDPRGYEDADKCAWTFGQNISSVNGAYYNMTLPALSVTSRNFLIQRELDVNSLCYVNYVTKAQ